MWGPTVVARFTLAKTDANCHDCPIRHRAVCANCNDSELEELNRIRHYRTWKAGETVAWAGEKMSVVGSVVTGVATLSSTLADGRRQMVGLLLPSDFMGRPGRHDIAYDVVAATDTTFCLFQREQFDRFLQKSPNIAEQLLEKTLDELDSAREWMLLLGRKTAREKIASLLVMMARRDGALHRNEPGDGLVFPLHITREAIADYLGLTVETVSRQISAMKRENIIQLVDTRTIRVPEFNRLIEQSAADSGALDGQHSLHATAAKRA